MSTSVPKASTSTHKTQKLSKNWLTDPVKSKYVSGEIGDIEFTCKICQRKFKCESCYDHIKWHEKNSTQLPKDPSQKTLNAEITQNLHRQKYELEITKFIFTNNLPFNVVDPLIELLKTVKKDDVIRQCDFSKIDRKHISVIGSECLAKTIKHDLEKIMDNRHFCVLIDEVSDGYGNGYLGISIKWLDDDLNSTIKFYRLINLENDYSAEKIAGIIATNVLISEKRRNNLIALTTDGASTMAGSKTGVGVKTVEIVKHLFWLHCICHCFDLILDKATSNTISEISIFVKDVSKTFSFSNVNHALLHDIQEENKASKRKILRFIPTRWLSMTECLQRILEEWNSLTLFF